MDLTCGDRLILVHVFPANVPPLLVGIANRLAREIPLTEDEFAEFGVVEEANGLIRWNPEIDTAREFNIGPKAKKLLADALTSAPKLPTGLPVELLLEKFGVVLEADE